MIETQTHGDNHQAPHTRARILVTYFDGAMDAGASGRMAVEQMLRSLPATHVADFDAEDFINYRSHRPVITVKSWVTEEVETPKISLDLLRDDRGESFLLLHGPEPDYRWETFASRDDRDPFRRSSHEADSRPRPYDRSFACSRAATYVGANPIPRVDGVFPSVEPEKSGDRWDDSSCDRSLLHVGIGLSCGFFCSAS